MILGKYTIDDLRSFLDAKDQDVAAAATAFTSFRDTWAAKDPASEQAWLSSWLDFQSRWNTARANAEAEIGSAQSSVLPDSENPAGDDAYHGLLTALSPNGAGSPGSFQDLWDRLVAAKGGAIAEAPEPQPKPDPDSDILYQGGGQGGGGGRDGGGGSSGSYANPPPPPTSDGPSGPPFDPGALFGKALGTILLGIVKPVAIVAAVALGGAYVIKKVQR